jgi:hypothetical protein
MKFRNAGQAQAIQQKIDQCNSTIRMSELRLRDPNMAEVDRRRLLSTIMINRQQVQQLRAEKRRLIGVEP